MGNWRQSLPDPRTWWLDWPNFLFKYNAQPITGSSTVSRGNLAHSSISPSSVMPALREFKTGITSQKKVTPVSGISLGPALLSTKQRSRGDLPYREVEVLDVQGHRALVSIDGSSSYAPLRDLRPLASVDAPLFQGASSLPQQLLVPTVADAQSPLPTVAEVQPSLPTKLPLDSWVVYRDAGKAWVGKLQSDCKEGQLLIHSGIIRKNKFVPQFVDDKTADIKASALQPPGFSPANYVVSKRSTLGFFPPSDALPADALILMADFRRDPGSFPWPS